MDQTELLMCFCLPVGVSQFVSLSRALKLVRQLLPHFLYLANKEAENYSQPLSCAVCSQRVFSLLQSYEDWKQTALLPPTPPHTQLGLNWLNKCNNIFCCSTKYTKGALKWGNEEILYVRQEAVAGKVVVCWAPIPISINVLKQCLNVLKSTCDHVQGGEGGVNSLRPLKDTMGIWQKGETAQEET